MKEQDFGGQITGSMLNWAPGITLEQIEKQVILLAFRWYRGNKTQCAISLGINVRTLERKLEEYEATTNKQREQERRDEIERAEILDRQRGIVPSSRNEEGGARLYGANSGIRAQSPPETPAQQPVPVPEREEIQAVLPKQTASSGQQRRR